MKSWYELDKKRARKLEKEFLEHEVAREENLAMHLQIILGIFLVVICFSILFALLIVNKLNVYLFVLLLLGTIIGMIIIVMATIEYHIKFNSWLLIKYKIVKK